ncbi:hypothetical protein IAR55_000264 [Kwoniella newhampshirensis]|uniref:Nuclear speckle splicing regulatory protein 1 N-terminal domain-containing protein n=1 Tax=Kwoniella newhampshirensis TaxID=1651941 RepID=A0AAW0Z6E7_9TREE
MFKKRSRPTSVREKKVEETEEEVVDKEGEGSGSGGEEVDETARTIEELVLLRKLRKSQSQQGIDLEKLNRGEQKKSKGGKKKDEKEKDAADIYGLQAGLGRDEKDEETANESEKAKRLVRANNFTQQTNALDVDKHMMAYIETELSKRRGEAASDPSTGKEAEPFDPQAELYKIAEKYKFESAKKATAKDDDEGNVTNSLGMLTSIPEVDLGMDNRLRNIEETEKAKREMMEKRKQEAVEAALRGPQEEDYAAARFFRPNQRVASDIYAIQEAKREAAGQAPRHENATDEQVYERFKKR